MILIVLAITQDGDDVTFGLRYEIWKFGKKKMFYLPGIASLNLKE